MKRVAGPLAAIGVVAVVLMATMGPALAATRTVQVGSFFFEDGTMGDGQITAAVGDRITFQFQNGQGNHTATVDGQFDSGNKNGGTTFTTSPLLVAGTFTLYCNIHGRQQHGARLVVTGDEPTPSPTPTTRSASPAPRRTTTSTKTTTATTTPPSTVATATSTKVTSQQPRPATTAPKATSPQSTASATPVPKAVAASLSADPLDTVPIAADDDRSSGLRIAAFVVLGLIPVSLFAAWYLRRNRDPS